MLATQLPMNHAAWLKKEQNQFAEPFCPNFGVLGENPHRAGCSSLL
jgi:hypothetical protein